MDADLSQKRWELPPRKDKYTYADILPVEYVGIDYQNLRYVMQDGQAESGVADIVYDWIINSRFHSVVENDLRRGRNTVNIGNLVGLYTELKTMILLARMLPNAMIGIQVDENNQVVFPTFRGRNQVQFGMHGGSVILTDPRLGPSDIKKKEIDFLMGQDTEYGLIPIIGQVKLRLNEPTKVETDIGINRMAFFTKVFNKYPGFVPIFFTLMGNYSEEVTDLIARYRYVGGTHVPIRINNNVFDSIVNQYSHDYGLDIRR